MKCVITGVNIKVFARSIHSLARIGDELYVEPGREGVSFCTVNSSRSAFASFQFGRSFFSQCESVVDVASSSQSSSSQSDAAETIKCKVAMRAFLGAFKSLSSVEKTVERCKIVVDNAAAKVIVQLTCRYSVVRNYHFPFIECETLRAVYDESSCPYAVTSPSRLLSDVVVNFQPGQDEVSLKVSSTSASVRNYVDDEPDLSKVVRTELKLESDEFDAYDVQAEGEVVFNLKELRAVLSFSEPCNLPVTARFSQPGSPIIFSVDHKPLFEGKFVLATLASAQAPESQAGLPSTAPITALRDKNSAEHRTPRAERSEQHHVVEHHADKARNEPSTSKVSDFQNESCQSAERLINADVDDFENDDVPLITRTSKTLHSVTADVHCRADDQDCLRNGNHSSRNSLHQPISPPNSSNREECSAIQPNDVTCNGSYSKGLGADLENPKLTNNNTIDEGIAPCEFNDSQSSNVVNRIPSPPAKKMRKHFLFYRCFNSTYNAHDENNVLAPDSDPED